MYKCACGCGSEIPKTRIDALIMLEIPEHEWTIIEHSMTRPILGIWSGESGTSELILTDKLGDYGIQRESNDEREITIEQD